ncbi:MAG: hypothetical protein AUJ07_08635 [Crenarchaeota archaeon 13_1_40CM_3_53_5]|nr:MAG: hypothetical protein AUJ07_08635 [Crenarchaeota archaeon 13_1_40CM_3_53_5]
MSLEPPPAWVLRAARARLNRTHKWSAYFDVMSVYYDIAPVKALVNPQLGSKIVAQYSSTPAPLIESKAETMSEQTALHEFFHHLFHQRRRRHSGEGEQALADQFAMECLELNSAGSPT